MGGKGKEKERDVLVEIDAAVGEFAEGSLLLELCRGDGLVSARLPIFHPYPRRRLGSLIAVDGGFVSLRRL